MINAPIWDLLEPLIFGSGAVCAYVVVLRRLADAAFAARLRLAELGEEALGRTISNDDRDLIGSMLDHAFSPLPALAAAILVPVLVVLILVRTPTRAPEDVSYRMPILRAFAISAFAANPVCGAIVALELLVIAAVVLVFLGHAVVAKLCFNLVRSVEKVASAAIHPAMVFHALGQK